MRRLHLYVIVLLSAAGTGFPLLAFPPGDEGPREIGRTTERELKVVISASLGTMQITRGEPEKIVLAEAPSGTESPIDISYAIRNRVGYLDITLGDLDGDKGQKMNIFHIGRLKSGTWVLRFSDAIPISFDIEQGVGKADLDLSGLQVKDFTLNSGASDATLSFDEPNRTAIDNLTVESGVSKFSGRNLGNANFKRFRFQGGVGSYTLDFSGSLHNEVDVDIELAFGALTVIVPPEVGARVFYDNSFMSRLDYAKDFSKTSESQYTSDNYTTAEGKMNIRIDSGVGSVNIRRR